MNKTIHIVLWVGFFLGTVILLAFSKSKQSNKECNSLIIDIDTETGMHFITEEDIIIHLRRNNNNPVGMKMGEIDILDLEKSIRKIPEIKSAEVFKKMNGEIGIKIHQRVPVVRVFNQSGRNFYIDEDGFQMPVSEKFSPRVLVFTGNINDPATDCSARELDLDPVLDKMYMADEIFKLAKFINDDDFWKAQIQQVNVNHAGEFELIPTVGNHRVMFGTLENMEGKFKKLFVFYKEGLNNTDWEKYDTINVKFKHQIICTKK